MKYRFGSNTAETFEGTSYDETFYAEGGNDVVLAGWGHDIAYGGHGTDTLFGEQGNDKLSGGADNDYLYGGEGDDLLIGGSGADVIDGGAESGYQDTASYAGSLGGVHVDLTYHFGTGGDAEGDVIFNVENLEGSAFNDSLHGDEASNDLVGLNGNDFLDGRGGNDLLIGGNGADNISGGAGFDTLKGGAGSDFLIGGTERDYFTFSAASHTGLGWGNRDTIMDFSANGVRDRIDLSGIDATSAPGDQAFSLVNGSFTDVAQVAVFHEGGNTYIRGNTNADLAPDFEIELIGHHQLTSLDFIF